jgi:hypothetical protein
MGGKAMKLPHQSTKPLIELSLDHYDCLVKVANQNSPLYFRLKNAVKMDGKVNVLCEAEEAEMLRQVAKYFCPHAVPQIEEAITRAQFSW